MSDRSIHEAIYKMAGLHKVDQVTYVNAVVNSVDLKARTCNCTVIEGHTEYELPTVKLMAVVDDGLFIEPAVGSVVKVLFSELIEPFVAQFSEIENVTIDARQKIQFNDGTFGGMIKIAELVTKINALENDLNTLKAAIASWTPVPCDGGAALKGVITNWSAQSLPVTAVNDIENTMVTHGK